MSFFVEHHVAGVVATAAQAKLLRSRDELKNLCRHWCPLRHTGGRAIDSVGQLFTPLMGITSRLSRKAPCLSNKPVAVTRECESIQGCLFFSLSERRADKQGRGL